MNRQLVVTGGPDQGKVFSITDGKTLVIGRGQASNSQLTDPHVSRVHCEAEVDGGTVLLIDCGSAGGTLVNSKPIERQELQPGDVIRIGQTQLSYQLEGVQEQSTLVTPDLSKPKPPPKGKPLKELIGESFSHYRLDKVLAKGLTGLVFLGHDTKKERSVAVKVLGPEFSGDEENMQRFVRAMKTMLPVRHENIVSIYAAGKNGPFCWVAMEYVDGEHLAEVIHRIGAAGQLDWRNAFYVALHIARALDAAYEHKIIHRNITPRNILLRTEDKVAKLGDLMLAKALEGSLAKQITQPGQLVGEVAYMSPERTRSLSEVDGRSDIYGLGATVYALLTGRPPFEGDSLPEMINTIRNTAPVKPKEYQLSIPDLFQDVVLRMLEKRPDDRHQTPRELIKELVHIGRYQGIEV